MANIITSPRSFKRKYVLAGTESAVGTDAVLTGTNWIEARSVTLTPLDAQTVERNIDLPHFGHAGQLMVGQYVKLSFDVGLTGSGTPGTPPKYAALLLACGMAETIDTGVSVTYNLVSDDIKSLTLYINIAGMLHKMVGSRGTVTLTLPAAGVPLLKFEFQSAYLSPIAEPPIAVTTTGWPVEEPVTARTTEALIFDPDGTPQPLAFSAFEIALNNQLARINLPGPQQEIVITDRKPSGNSTVLAPAPGWSPFAIAEKGESMLVRTTHGTTAGHKVQIDARVRITGADYEQYEGVLAYKLTMEPTPAQGNDEFAITCL